MTHSSSKFSVGLIVRPTKIWRWQSQLVKALVDAQLIDVIEVFVQGEEALSQPAATARLHKLDSTIFRSPMTAYELLDVDFPEVHISSDGVQRDSDAIVDLDLWINLSEQSVSNELIKKSKIGVLETHFSEVQSSESLSSANFGYSEFSRGQTQCYFSIMTTSHDGSVYTLTELRPSLDAGPLSRNLNQYWKLLEASWARVLKILHTQSPEQIQSNKAEVKTIVNPANTALKPNTPYQRLGNIFLDKFSQKFLRKEQWVLLLQFKNHATDSCQMPLSFADYSEISPPADCFWADPFVVSEQDRHYVFFEELPFATDRGHLSCMEVFSDGSHTEPKIILKKPYHLSYPNVFAFESEYYMIPESGDNEMITLYRSTEFPYQWEQQRVLMEGLHAYDSTLLEHEGQWWLFACIAAEKGMSGCEELHIFSADSPLSQSWEPHPLNPIMSDASRARPAGNFFEWEGELYRPSQDCAGSYGAGLNINKVKTLDKQSYAEELVHCARPNWDPKLTALHTLNFNQHLSVADAMRVDSRFF